MKNEAKIQLRLPLELRDWLENHSARNDRSMNGQMIVILKNLMQQDKTPAQGEARE